MTLRVIIRRGKSDPFWQRRIPFTSQNSAKRVNDWLDCKGPSVSSLFCPTNQGKAIDRSLSTCSVKRMIKTATKNAGPGSDDIDAFSGHSLRVGAAQDLLSAGYDTAAIMQVGGNR